MRLGPAFRVYSGNNILLGHLGNVSYVYSPGAHGYVLALSSVVFYPSGLAAANVTSGSLPYYPWLTGIIPVGSITYVLGYGPMDVTRDTFGDLATTTYSTNTPLRRVTLSVSKMSTAINTYAACLDSNPQGGAVFTDLTVPGSPGLYTAKMCTSLGDAGAPIFIDTSGTGTGSFMLGGILVDSNDGGTCSGDIATYTSLPFRDAWIRQTLAAMSGKQWVPSPCPSITPSPTPAASPSPTPSNTPYPSNSSSPSPIPYVPVVVAAFNPLWLILICCFVFSLAWGVWYAGKRAQQRMREGLKVAPENIRKLKALPPPAAASSQAGSSTYESEQERQRDLARDGRLMPVHRKVHPATDEQIAAAAAAAAAEAEGREGQDPTQRSSAEEAREGKEGADVTEAGADDDPLPAPRRADLLDVGASFRGKSSLGLSDKTGVDGSPSPASISSVADLRAAATRQAAAAAAARDNARSVRRMRRRSALMERLGSAGLSMTTPEGSHRGISLHRFLGTRGSFFDGTGVSRPALTATRTGVGASFHNRPLSAGGRVGSFVGGSMYLDPAAEVSGGSAALAEGVTGAHYATGVEAGEGERDRDGTATPALGASNGATGMGGNGNAGGIRMRVVVEGAEIGRSQADSPLGSPVSGSSPTYITIPGGRSPPAAAAAAATAGSPPVSPAASFPSRPPSTASSPCAASSFHRGAAGGQPVHSKRRSLADVPGLDRRYEAAPPLLSGGSFVAPRFSAYS